MSYCVPGLESGTFSPALEMVRNSCLVTRVLGDGTFHVHRLFFWVLYTLTERVQVGDGSCLHSES